MDPITQQIALASAGAAAGDPVYVDEVFSTYLFDGTGSNQSINNGIDLSGEGGLVWIKRRDAADPSQIYDTERGANKLLRTTTTSGEVSGFSDLLTSFNSNGFSLGADSGGFGTNPSSSTMASWTFRKAPGFFDVVTYTGDGVDGRSINHSLGSKPGFFVVKCTSHSGENWNVYHTSLGATKYLTLDTTNAANTSSALWDDTEPTATTFTVADGNGTNGSGKSYIAYLWAHDDQSFGTDSDEAIIKCGTYEGSSSAGTQINLGFEPQFLLIKNIDSSGTDWVLYDNMRPLPVGGQDKHLNPNDNNAENHYGNVIELEPTGFKLGSSAPFVSQAGSNGNTYIYIAIRRSHKPPEAGTDVFDIDQLSGSQSSPAFRTGIVTDMGWARRPSTPTYYGGAFGVYDRLRGDKVLETASGAAEVTDGFGGDYMNGFYTSAISADIGYSFKRAAGFFDIVAFDDGSSTNQTIPHNLGVTPELLIVKGRDGSNNWHVWATGFSTSEYLRLDNNDAKTNPGGNVWGNATPTSSQFTFNTASGRLGFATKAITYLFASLDGISKVGSYTGTGNNINVDCGFTAGARLVLVKRTDSTGNWYLWDTTRGINSGNEPFTRVQTNLTDGSDDFIDPYNLGFTITSSASAQLNASGGTYLFLAIA